MNDERFPAARVSAAKAVLAFKNAKQRIPKREIAAEAAETAGSGSTWGDDLLSQAVMN
jgi:hypothetical protein